MTSIYIEYEEPLILLYHEKKKFSEKYKINKYKIIFYILNLIIPNQ